MITAVVGGQFGSEGKGAVVGHISKEHQIHVRVGAANAGHTVYVEGEPFVCQQLPCAAYANPTATLVLGPGALISPEILWREIEANAEWRKRKGYYKLHLYMDHRAHVVQEAHKQTEAKTDLAEKIGSTSTIAREGIGIAQAARVGRVGLWRTVAQHYGAGEPPLIVLDTVQLLYSLLESRRTDKILLEGTQGTGLSNTTGIYPFVTSRNTSVAGLIADCGVGPKDVDRVIMVCRSFPIRVAGNSGPFWPGSAEIDWQTLGINPESERTTVTKKVRRVATMSYEQLQVGAQMNSATEIALMFADYLNASYAGHPKATATAYETDGWDVIGQTIRKIEQVTGVPVTMLGLGPDTIVQRIPDLNSQSAYI